MEGLLNLNKPAGPTSHDLVCQVRHLLQERRIGHGGTLDPLAAGVLPIGVGRATRLLPFLQESDKVYRAEIRLGIRTTTYDAEGAVTAERPVPLLTWDELQQALLSFRGEIEQFPPPFSAIRQDGQRLYQRARAGQHVNPPARRVHILGLELLSWNRPDLVVEVTCGSGTYMRSLAHDLGERLGCGAYLRGLVRLRVGPLRLEEAVTLADLAAARERGQVEALLLPADLAVRHWPAVQVDADAAQALLRGRSVPLDLPEAERARAYDEAGRLLALLRFDAAHNLWRPWRVFPPAERAPQRHNLVNHKDTPAQSP